MQVVTGAMGSLLPKLGNLLKKEYELQKRVRAEIMFLKAELERMEAALVDISELPIDHQPPDTQVMLWARDVRDLSYEVEDSIDKFMVRIGEPQSFMGFIDRCLSLLTKAKIRHKIGTEVKGIKRRIHQVSEGRDRYKVDSTVAKPIGPTIDSLRLSALYTKATDLVGTDDKTQHLIRELMGADGDSEKQRKIVSVVGIGGLGKTTLANLVYKKLREKFHCGAFVSVSQNPNMEKIFKDLLYQLGKDLYHINDEDQLIREIRQHLEKKRYIIIMDDIWKTSVWKRIKHALIDNEYGSRIITTTRIHKVAEQAGGVYNLSPLSSIESRQLFNQRLFGVEDKCPPNHLHDISEKILKKCGGVPLAIITIASMLASKTEKEYTHRYWSLVYRSMGSGLQNSSDDLRDMRRILSVSYYDLPAHLKTCLLYLSLYPEDHEINIKEVVWRWIGEGFIHDQQGRSLYEVGEDYFHELISKSLIQPLDIDVDNKAKSCRIHDMVLDLITFLSNEENFLTPIIGGQLPVSTRSTIRRLSFHTSEEDVKQPSTMSLSHVRSVIVFSKAFSPSLEIMGTTFPVLRVLDVSDCKQIKNQHCKEICRLLHLRYLRLRGTSITEIPKEIGKLRFLQVLDITETEIVEQLPSTFDQLTELVLLDMLNSIVSDVPTWLSSLCSLSSLSITLGTLRDEYIQALGSMTSLGELFIQVEKPTQGRNKRFVIDGASPLFPCLRKFTIRSLHSEMDLLFAQGAMQKLQKLELQLGPFMTTGFADFDFGLENLSSLEYVCNGMIYSNEQRQQALDGAIQEALQMNPNKPKMIRPKVRVHFMIDVCSDKDRARAMGVVAAYEGTESIGLSGSERNVLVVDGRFNWTHVVQKLRDKVGHAEMLQLRML
uniref:Uncharacterized protein n=1 Tax=Avena sativa TaxID=4498 RepID=A0ACD5WR67_AVESA